jgi:hypothetical protein
MQLSLSKTKINVAWIYSDSNSCAHTVSYAHPRYSFMAAAWITVGAEGLMLLLNYFVSTKASGIQVSLKMLSKFV